MSSFDDRLYTLYRQRLHHTHGRPQKKTRNVHRIEKWFYFWPMHLFIWSQRKRVYPENTTNTVVKEDA